MIESSLNIKVHLQLGANNVYRLLKVFTMLLVQKWKPGECGT